MKTVGTIDKNFEKMIANESQGIMSNRKQTVAQFLAEKERGMSK